MASHDDRTSPKNHACHQPGSFVTTLTGLKKLCPNSMLLLKLRMYSSVYPEQGPGHGPLGELVAALQSPFPHTD